MGSRPYAAFAVLPARLEVGEDWSQVDAFPGESVDQLPFLMDGGSHTCDGSLQRRRGSLRDYCAAIGGQRRSFCFL
jgi:hypothetical protein